MKTQLELCSDGIWRPAGNRRHRSMSEVIERFWKHVVKGSGQECWVWSAGKNSNKKGNNYGVLGHLRKRIRAHRFSFEIHFGKIPDGKMVLHKCDNPPCVNPNHLFLGDAKANATDMVKKGRHRNGQMVHPEIIKRGEDHWKHKLSGKDMVEIRVSAKKTKNLMRQFGVSKATIYDIKLKRTWRHIQ